MGTKNNVTATPPLLFSSTNPLFYENCIDFVSHTSYKVKQRTEQLPYVCPEN